MSSTKKLLSLKDTLLVVVLLLLFLVPKVHADDWSDKFSFNGYYSLDFTYVDDDLNLVSSSTNNRLFKKNKIETNNSVIGGQLQYQFTDNLSAFVQGSLTTDNNDSLETNIDWAYLSYEFNNNVTARLGQFQIPFLSGTELRKIGFSRLWIRPLIPGNGASGNEDFVGIDLLKRYSSGDNNWEFQFSAGKANHGLDDIDNKNMKLFAARYQRHDFWIRTALMHTEYSVTSPRGIMITNSGHALLGSIESEAKLRNFQFNAGYSNTSAKVVPEDSMAYLSIAYPLNKITPYVFGVKRKQHFEAFEVPAPNGPPTGPPPMGPPPSPPVGDRNVYSLAIGIRIDLAPKYALKFQIENIRSKDESRLQNGITSTEGTAFSVVLEGVF